MEINGRDVIYCVSTKEVKNITFPQNNMSLYKNTFRIESTRLKEYDYSQPGEYFVTICTNEHKCLFGTVLRGCRFITHWSDRKKLLGRNTEAFP